MTSIRSRILVLLIPLTAAARAAVAVGIHEAARRDLVAALDRTLLVTARGVDASLDLEVGGEVEFELDGGSALEFGDPEEAFYVVAREDGEVFSSSLASPPDLPRPGPEATCSDVEVHGRSFRVLSLAVVKEPEDDEEDREEWLGDHPGQPLPEIRPEAFAITVGRSTREVEEAQAALLRRLLAGFGILFAALVVIPAAVVSWALRPLRTLSSQARGVGPDAPQARLDEEGIDQEVHSLVHAFNRALERLAAAYEQQRRFSADAAHELRTPLAAIRTTCEVALRAPPDPAGLRKALEGIHRTVLRTARIVESLLALSRFQLKGAVPMAPTELRQVAQEAVRMNAPAALAKGVHLSIGAANGAVVRGNEDFLVECVSNLLDNAIRYTPPEGRVRVETGATPEPFVAVEDTGIGIPAEHLDRIFDRFYRVDRSRSREEGGTGLGLAIAGEVARLHGGEIQVESQPGKGSRFVLRLPRRTRAGAGGATA